MMNASNVLCVFVKAPILGRVKTRMQPELSSQDTLLIYRAMTEDLLASLDGELDFEIVLFFWPQDGEKDVALWLGSTRTLVPQRGNDLGERMLGAFEWAHERSFEKTVVIGSDIPGLDARVVAGAFNRLATSDVVLGPSFDGGYYLIGMKRPHPELFAGIPWSNSNVYQQTLAVLRRLALTAHVLDEMDDMDTVDDLRRLWRSGELCERSKLHEILRSLFEAQ